jgi:hypothetical protein
VAGRGTTRRSSRADAKGYLGKAVEYLEAAKMSLDRSNNTAAAGNSVHAGIAAADAIAAARLGSVWKGEHDRAPAHVREAGEEGKQASRALERLLVHKNRAEYDPTPVSGSDARKAVERANELVRLAGVVLAPES